MKGRFAARKKERRDRLLQAWKDIRELEEARLQLQKEAAALETSGRNSTHQDVSNRGRS